MTENHTPGPWTVQTLNHRDGEVWLQIGWIENGTEVGPICEVSGGAAQHRAVYHPVAELKHLIAPEPEQRANARLIAAAPAMYAALKAILYDEVPDPSHYRDSSVPRKAIQLARKAISVVDDAPT